MLRNDSAFLPRYNIYASSVSIYIILSQLETILYNISTDVNLYWYYGGRETCA